jgi:hypothetical protein
MYNETRGLVNITVIRKNMETSESLIWFFIPIFLSIVIGALLIKKKWFSFIKLVAIGVTLGIGGVIFAPTGLCTSMCDKTFSAGMFSLFINPIFLLFAIFWFKCRNSGRSV